MNKNMTTYTDSDSCDSNDETYEEIESFEKSLESRNKGVKTDLERFDSGAVMLDIFLTNKLFVLAYSPTIGFGVDEVREEDNFRNSYQFYFQDLECAQERLRLLMGLEADT